jgi:hypothetical protein
MDVAVSPDGRLTARVGFKPSVGVCETATAKRFKDWMRPELIIAITFASDSPRLAAACSTGAIYLLRLEGSKAAGR